jgi:hypothetical protein
MVGMELGDVSLRRECYLSLNVRNKLNEWETVQDSDMNIYSMGEMVTALSDFHVMRREIVR